MILKPSKLLKKSGFEAKSFPNYNKSIKQLKKNLHDIKDLKFSFVIYILLISTGIKRYYEFRSTIFERFFYIKFFEKKFLKKTKLKKYYGNDISKFFNFEWRTNLNGFAVIIEYNRFLKGNEKIMEDILTYNEDDCRATDVLIKELSKVNEVN